jgi:hypothetical protein
MKNAGVLLVIGILVGASVMGGAYFLGKQARLTASPVPPSPSLAQTSPAVSSNGTIEGSLGYPSEGIPTNMMVCAETLQAVKVVCTSTQLKDPKYQYGVGYNLEVSPGSYYVYAQVPGNNYKAYFSEFVPCGLSVNCPSHEPIEVKVSAGATVTGIDPQDWYNTAP